MTNLPPAFVILLLVLAAAAVATRWRRSSSASFPPVVRVLRRLGDALVPVRSDDKTLVGGLLDEPGDPTADLAPEPVPDRRTVIGRAGGKMWALSDTSTTTDKRQPPCDVHWLMNSTGYTVLNRDLHGVASELVTYLAKRPDLLTPTTAFTLNLVEFPGLPVPDGALVRSDDPDLARWLETITRRHPTARRASATAHLSRTGTTSTAGSTTGSSTTSHAPNKTGNQPTGTVPGLWGSGADHRPALLVPRTTRLEDQTVGGFLQLVRIGQASQTYLITREVLTVGRHPVNTVVLDDERVSTYHAQVWAAPDGRVQVQDCDSTNGTHIRGKRCDAIASAEHGDEISFAGVRFRVVRGLPGRTVRLTGNETQEAMRP